MIKLFAKTILYIHKAYDRALMHLYKSLFCNCGKNVIFFPTNSQFLYKNISIGNNVSIGYGATFIAALSHITIGNNTIISSNVTIRGGDHASHIIGKLMKDYRNDEKLITDDEQVVIDEDVYIGVGAVILKGVHIGRGAIINAGAIVKENVPPYVIVSGVPAKIVNYRWSNEEILQHEEFAYVYEDRLRPEPKE